MKRSVRARGFVWTAAATALLAASPPAHAIRGGGMVGPRGGAVGHVQGPMRSGTVVQGPRGGSVGHVEGPVRDRTVIEGPRGGTMGHVEGPVRGGTVVRGPYGGGAGAVHGPYGGGAVVRSPGGGVVAGRGVYARPGWNSTRIYGYQRGYVGYPGWRTYGVHYGLVAPLATFASLSFLSAGLLVGSYLAEDQTVYVYVVQEDGQDVEYRVAADGTVLSRRVIS